LGVYSLTSGGSVHQVLTDRNFIEASMPMNAKRQTPNGKLRTPNAEHRTLNAKL